MTRGDALVATLAGALAALAGITLVGRWLHPGDATIVALAYLLVVLGTAAVSRLWMAVAVSVIGVLCLNYFFMPPLGTFRIADPENWAVLAAFLAVGVIGSQLSASARRSAEEAMARREQFLEERKRAEVARQGEELKSALLASLSHDLRTPLTTIRLAASNLQASWLDDEDRREQSDLVGAEVARLSRLFENILEMARIDAGAVAADRRWVHPMEIVEAACDHAGEALRHRRVETHAEGGMLVRLDPRLTASALAHLLENAAQYSPADGVIAVDARPSAEGLSITVRDHGPGIAPADLPRLFNGFYRGSVAGQRASGTGMGLAIARGLLTAEGGRVSAENCADGGARFTIVVPADQKRAEVMESLA